MSSERLTDVGPKGREATFGALAPKPHSRWERHSCVARIPERIAARSWLIFETTQGLVQRLLGTKDLAKPARRATLHSSVKITTIL
jgi:hypothetical protein